MIIATAGHVDHGKTALVAALTGIDTDRLAEEKQRGLTIDLGFAYTDTKSGGRLGFIDVPGHIRFISNMLAGVAAIDQALLVVALDDGVMPQTVEHLEILNLLGINQGIIALTKTDRCDLARVASVTSQVKQLVAGSFLDQADIYPVSAVTGEGIAQLRIALEAASDETGTDKSQVDAACFRLAIDRSFNIKGTGLVVTGSVFSGRVSKGDAVYLMPGDISLRVRGLHTQNQPATSAQVGDRCAVNITGNQLKPADIHRGNWLSTNPGEPTKRVDVMLSLAKSEQKPVSHWTPVHLHAAANHVTARLAILESGKLGPGEMGLVQLVLDASINLCTGDRVIVRNQSAERTLGGGIVIDPWSPKRGRARPERIAYLHDLALAISQTSATKCLHTMLKHFDTGISMQRLAGMFNLRKDALSRILGTLPVLQLEDGGILLRAHLLNHYHWLETKLSAWHESHPDKPGLAVNQIHQTFARHWSSGLLRYVVTQMLKQHRLTQEGNLLRHPEHRLHLSNTETALWQKIESLLQVSPTKPPVLHDLAAQCSIQPRLLEKTLQRVAQLGLVVHPVKNRYFLPAALEELQSLVDKTAKPDGSFTVQQFRDASGIGRNLSIEILEHFDRQGITRRIGDRRELL